MWGGIGCMALLMQAPHKSQNARKRGYPAHLLSKFIENPIGILWLLADYWKEW
jgi:hypothetical protein